MGCNHAYIYSYDYTTTALLNAYTVVSNMSSIQLPLTAGVEDILRSEHGLTYITRLQHTA